jgi:hypothetical protein
MADWECGMTEFATILNDTVPNRNSPGYNMLWQALLPQKDQQAKLGVLI